MKFLVIGLGSMGKRRVRCLKALGHTDIVAYDPREDRRAEAAEKYGIETVADYRSVGKVDAWVISTPPDTHSGYALEALDSGASFFSEANVTDPRAHEVMAKIKETGLAGCPSATLRWYPGPRTIKSLIAEGAIGKPLSFSYQSGQYLPDWHPWESYKDFYVSKRETGACREIVPFELAWIVDVFGEVKTLTCLKDKVSDLDADIDDIYQVLMKFNAGTVGHLVVDVLARPAMRFMRINGSEGSIEWDYQNNCIRVWRAATGAWETIDLSGGNVEAGYIHAEEPYIAEIADFVAAVKGEKPWPYPYEEDERVLSLLVRAEKSAAEGVHC